MKQIIGMAAVLFGVIFSAVADIYLKKSDFSDYKLFLIGLSLYAFAALPTAFAFKFIDFGIVYLAWEAMAVILGLGIGAYLFNEGITPLKIAALSAALLAVVLSYLASRS